MEEKQLITFTIMQQDIKSIKDNLIKNDICHRELSQKLDDMINSMDKKYAAKWVENAWIYVISIIGLAIFAGIFKLILI